MPRDFVSIAASAAEVCGPPTIWNRLSQEDHSEYFRYRVHFHQTNRSGNDHRVAGFHRELISALSYIERRSEGQEDRSIVCGVAFAGPYICVNTRLLKAFLGRCKSSINGSFMQMGYVALRTKSKARSCVLSCLHSLIDDEPNLRQWTVRCASQSALFCINSSFARLDRPEILESDLIQPVKKSPLNSILAFSRSFVKPVPRLVDLPALVEDAECDVEKWDLTPSWNMPSLEPSFEPDLELKPEFQSDVLLMFDDLQPN
jgi:hypothetical protein